MDFPGFIGPSYRLFSSKASVDRAINLMLERIESGQGINANTFYRSPGLSSVINAGGNCWRGLYELNDHVFGVLDGTVYDLIADYTSTTYGPIANVGGRPVVMAGSATSLLIVSDGVLYRINGGLLTTPVLSFTPVSVVFLANYFVALSADMQQFYFSVDDGVTWDAADFQTAEAAANNLLAMIVHNQTLFIYGNRICQAFLVGSNADAPFEAQNNGVINMGILAPASLQSLGEARFWLGRNKDGQGIVYKSTGYDFIRVSNHAVENAIRGYAAQADAIGWIHQTNGHNCYRLTFDEATWEYDDTENNWVEVGRFDPVTGLTLRHRGNCSVSAFGKTLVGDYDNGKLYEMSPDFYDDDLANGGERIEWERIAPHIIEGNKNVAYDSAEILGETGVGDGSNLDPALGAVTPEADPTIMFSYSDNGGKTFSNELQRSMGQVGDYSKRMVIDRLGVGRDRVFKVRGSAAVKLCLTGMVFDAEALAS